MWIPSVYIGIWPHHRRAGILLPYDLQRGLYRRRRFTILPNKWERG
jgi:hypothetical protein